MMYCKIYHTPARHQLDGRFRSTQTSISCPVRDIDKHLSRLSRWDCKIILILYCDHIIFGYATLNDVFEFLQ